MSLPIGQLLFVGISGPSLTAQEKKFLIENDIGGVILFSRNITTPEALHSLCGSIQALSKLTKSRLPFFIGIDNEGGRVMRLKEPFTAWPPLAHIGQIDSPNLSFQVAASMGLELRAFGINLDFAPCADVLTNPQNKVIGDRAISTDPEMVSKHVSALTRGFLKTQVIPCVKHFPGHGNTLLDSHEELPVENLTYDQITAGQLKPFLKAFKSRAPMVMSAHILFQNIDPKWPATLSEVFLKKILRDDLRYRGLVVTDDLGMKALTKHHSTEEIAVRALAAGADLLLYCNEPEAPPKAIDAIYKALAEGTLTKSLIAQSLDQITALKHELLIDPEPWPLNEALACINDPFHKELAAAMRENRVPPGLSANKDSN